jgi:hypothetical protein
MASKKKAPADSAANDGPGGSGGPIAVRATRTGFHGHVLREKGAEFTIASRDELGSWMEEVSPVVDVPAPTTEE